MAFSNASTMARQWSSCSSSPRGGAREDGDGATANVAPVAGGEAGRGRDVSARAASMTLAVVVVVVVEVVVEVEVVGTGAGAAVMLAVDMGALV